MVASKNTGAATCNGSLRKFGWFYQMVVELSYGGEPPKIDACFVENYVDHDPSDGWRDFRCGSRTYNGHRGTDFRIPSLVSQREGVELLAAAPGRIQRMRDGIGLIGPSLADNNLRIFDLRLIGSS